MSANRVRSLIGTLTLAAVLVGCTGPGNGTGTSVAATSSGDLPAIIPITEQAGAVATYARPFPDWLTIAGESSVAAGEGGVYVMSGGAITPTIARVDPITNAMSSTFPAPDGSKALRAGLGGLWVSSPTRGTVSRLDPATGATVATIKISSGGEDFLTVGFGSVWVLNNNAGTVARIDPSTNTVTTRIQATNIPIEGGDIAAGGGYVWARVTDALVAKIDPTTNMVIARYGPPSGSGSVAANDQAVWISAHNKTTIWRLHLT
ncbi:MAG TPA: hypothetical protein VII33_06225 [Nakamurella sp.]